MAGDQREADAPPGQHPVIDQLKLMTVEEIAAVLRREPKTIRNWVAKRQIPFVFLNGRTMFRPAQVRAWLDSKEVKAWD